MLLLRPRVGWHAVGFVGHRMVQQCLDVLRPIGDFVRGGKDGGTERVLQLR